MIPTTKSEERSPITWREGDVFVAQDGEHDISSYGDTEQEALESLTEAVELYLEEL